MPKTPEERRKVYVLVAAIILVLGVLAVVVFSDDGGKDDESSESIDSGEAIDSVNPSTTTTTRPVATTTTTTRPPATTTPPTTAARPQQVSHTPAPASNVEQVAPAPAPEPAPEPPPAEPLCDKPVPTTRPEEGGLNSGAEYTENCGLSFTPSTDCPWAGPVVRLNNARGFQPGQRYYSTIWYPDGRYYTPDQGNVGTVNSDGSLPWMWTCQAKDQPPAGHIGTVTYTVLLVVPDTNQWIAFKILVAPPS